MLMDAQNDILICIGSTQYQYTAKMMLFSDSIGNGFVFKKQICTNRYFLCLYLSLSF